ncbi:MAG: hypothetical protein ABID87_07165 [Chloroflexota bacterium]
MNAQYEVLSPWADVDPVPLRGISPRLDDLTGKTIGLFSSNHKPASTPILKVVEKNLRERFPSLKFRWFFFDYNLRLGETEEYGRFQAWVKGIDAAVAAVGD